MSRVVDSGPLGGGENVRTLKNTDGSRKVVDSPSSLEGGGDDRGGRDEVVGEGVVEVALQ